MKNLTQGSSKVWMGLALAGGLMASGLAQAEPNRGTVLANTCVGCHGIDGISAGPAIPSIAGLSKDYFVEAMNQYASGERPSTIMGRLAKGYNADDIDAMADYFANLKYVQVQQPHDKKLAAIGKTLHKQSCSKCHDAGGTVADDDAGFLSGQIKPYLQYSFEDFSSGERVAPKRMQKAMQELHSAHGDKGFEALIEYYASGKE